MTEHVLIIGSGGRTGLPALVRRLGGARTSVLCRLPVLGRVADPGEHRRVLGVPAGADSDQWIAAARYIHGVEPVTVVTSFTENDQEHAAGIAADLGLAWHGPEVVRLVHDKAAMRRRLAGAGLDDTPFRQVHDPAELAGFVREHGPGVVKPLDGTGSAGVSRLADPDGARAAYLRAAGARPGPVLVESELEGVQLSVECLTHQGRHVVVGTTRKYSDPACYTELGHVSPAPLGRDEAAEVAALVVGALDALGIGFGPTHTEVVLTRRGPRIIETHLRLAGDQIPDLVGDVTGVDLARSTVWQLLGGSVVDAAGEPVHRDEPVAAASAIWYAAAAVDGVLAEVTGVADACRLPGVVAVEVSVAAGDRLRRLGSSWDRVGWVRTHGGRPEEAVHRARTGCAAIGLRLRGELDPWAATV